MVNKSKKVIVPFLMIVTIYLIFLCEVYISYNKLTTTHYNITTNKINNSVNIVIISDLHDNQLGNNNEKLIKEINLSSPDIILFVGDGVNKDSQNSKILINLIKQLSRNNKVFYSLGNTDINYIEIKTSDLEKELENAGATVLDNEYKDINIRGNNIRIGGIYSYAFGLNDSNEVNRDITKKRAYDFLSSFQDTESYKIIMSHRPDSFIFGDASQVWDIDLVVSGHTHGGQARIPFLGGVYGGDQVWFPKYDKGLFDLNKIKIIVSSGLGSGNEKIPRFNNPPEIINLEIN